MGTCSNVTRSRSLYEVKKLVHSDTAQSPGNSNASELRDQRNTKKGLILEAKGGDSRESRLGQNLKIKCAIFKIKGPW